mmetsp:Transcript_53914/g.73654  ORF Transcript_53914/g.73654 Transcript_53914/m.73654 type:complete len:80 (+) Transcript_53914:694-933(+)
MKHSVKKERNRYREVLSEPVIFCIEPMHLLYEASSALDINEISGGRRTYSGLIARFWTVDQSSFPLRGYLILKNQLSLN